MQAKTVSVGPVTAAVANQVAASQTPYAGQIVLNGAGATFSIDNVATAQNPASAGNLTLAASVVSFSPPRYLYITSASDDTSFTFTVTGLDQNGRALTEIITGANTRARSSVNQFTAVSNIAVSGNCGSVQVGSFASASFTGSTARQVTITPTGNESTNTFVVTGIGVNNEALTESVAGKNALVSTTNSYFLTVTSVTIANDAANALTVGMTNTATSPWVRFDDFAPSNISIQCSVTGLATYTVQSTLQDPNDPISPVSASALTWVDTSDLDAVGATSTVQSNFLFAPKLARVVITTTSTGSVSSVFLQSSNGPI